MRSCKNWILLNSDYGSLPRAGNGAQIGGAGEDLGQEPRQGPDSRATSHLSMSVSRKAGSLEGGTGPCGGFVTLSCIMTSLGFTFSTQEMRVVSEPTSQGSGEASGKQHAWSTCGVGLAVGGRSKSTAGTASGGRDSSPMPLPGRNPETPVLSQEPQGTGLSRHCPVWAWGNCEWCGSHRSAVSCLPSLTTPHLSKAHAGHQGPHRAHT